MTAIKKGDFIELDYVGKLANTGKIFDLTDAELAKKEGILNPQQKYGPVTICVGEGMLVGGIDAFVLGKEPGKSYDLELEPANAFGPRIAKLIQLVSIKKFKDHKMNPYPGARIMIDNMPATIRSISGGRVLVDFNHPLAGKKLQYHLKIGKIVTDVKAQATSLLEKFIPAKEYSLALKDAGKSVKGKVLTIKLKNKAQFGPFIEKLTIDMRRLIKSLSKITVE
tara:strand:- start:139 stop:810 length:672 start_codon:yes stop_codon:yes gene_type:complete